jgi:hypothetical protein
VRIQARFKNGLPPHLQADATSMTYAPGSDQSRIFVASHSAFLSLEDREVQRILRQRLILVHGHPFDYNYGWDLKSFARLHDVDKKVSVLGKPVVACLPPLLTKTPFSFHTSSSPFPRTSPLPGNLEAISLDKHLPATSGVSPPQCAFTSGIATEPSHSLSVREHGVA